MTVARRGLVVCLPSYNEEGNLADLIRDTHDAVPYALILVVDDGSTDRTRAIAAAAAGTYPVVVEPHARNRGLAEAMRTALIRALDLVDPDGFVVSMDADGSHRPDQIPQLVEAARRGAELVVAGRYLEGSTVAGVPWFRKILSVGARVFTRVALGNLHVRDVSCGYRLYRASLVRRAFEAWGEGLIVSPGFSVNLELLVKMSRIGARVDQIPLRLRYDLKQGESKIRIVRTVIQYLRVYAHLALARPPRLPAPTPPA
ncbi:glycosyltransferase [bacterium]|nr:glycosyltransferase [bacterium]